MFPYGTLTAQGMTIKQASPTKDMVESKTYQQTGTGPLTQPEFYVYVNGEIELTNGSFTQLLTGSQSGFDVTLQQYDISQPVVEKVISGAAARFSISAATPVEKAQYELEQGEAFTFSKNSILFVMSGIVEGTSFAISGFAFRAMDVGSTITAQTAAKIVVCNLAD